jgi:hypothetical protein
MTQAYGEDPPGEPLAIARMLRILVRMLRILVRMLRILVRMR